MIPFLFLSAHCTGSGTIKRATERTSPRASFSFRQVLTFSLLSSSNFFSVGLTSAIPCAIAMQKPFPDLIQLGLTPSYDNEIALPDPDSLLGGSEPCLRLLALNSIPFPEPPKLLPSTTQLILLCLRSNLDSGYILPETIAACLSALTGLQLLLFGPPSYRSLLLPPPTRSIPPALTDEMPRSGVSESVRTKIRT